jgi:hypothetical protein
VAAQEVKLYPCASGWLYTVIVAGLVRVIGLAKTRERAEREASIA